MGGHVRMINQFGEWWHNQTITTRVFLNVFGVIVAFFLGRGLRYLIWVN